MKLKIATNTFIDRSLFIVKAQLFHGLTRKEALMLWNDGIDTLHSSVETIVERT
jgi:hypothetical protein